MGLLMVWVVKCWDGALCYRQFLGWVMWTEKGAGEVTHLFSRAVGEDVYCIFIYTLLGHQHGVEKMVLYKGKACSTALIGYLNCFLIWFVCFTMLGGALKWLGG